MEEYRWGPPNVTYRYWKPRTDILEEGNNVIVEFELPGVNADEIVLLATENTLTLQSRKHMSKKELTGTHFLR